MYIRFLFEGFHLRFQPKKFKLDQYIQVQTNGQI